MFDINSIKIQDIIPISENKGLYEKYELSEENLNELMNLVIDIKNKVKETHLDIIRSEEEIIGHYKWCCNNIWPTSKFKRNKDFEQYIYEFVFYDFYLTQRYDLLDDFIEIFKEIIDISTYKDRAQFETLLILDSFYKKMCV